MDSIRFIVILYQNPLFFQDVSFEHYLGPEIGCVLDSNLKFIKEYLEQLILDYYERTISSIPEEFWPFLDLLKGIGSDISRFIKSIPYVELFKYCLIQSLIWFVDWVHWFFVSIEEKLIPWFLYEIKNFSFERSLDKSDDFYNECETRIEFHKAIIEEESGYNAFNEYCQKKWCNIDWAKGPMEVARNHHILLWRGPLLDMYLTALARQDTLLIQWFHSEEMRPWLKLYGDVRSIYYLQGIITHDNKIMLGTWNEELFRVNYDIKYFTYCYDMLKYKDYSADPERSLWVFFFRIWLFCWYFYDKAGHAKYMGVEDNMLIAEADNKRNWKWLWAVVIWGGITLWSMTWCASNDYVVDDSLNIYHQWQDADKRQLEEIWWQGDLTIWRQIEEERSRMSWSEWMCDWRMPLLWQLLGYYEPDPEEVARLEYEKRVNDLTMKIYTWLRKYALSYIILFFVANSILIEVYARIVVMLALKHLGWGIGTPKMNKFAADQLALGKALEKRMHELEATAEEEKESFRGLRNSQYGKKQKKLVF